jgi:hypothetical protein
MPGENQLLELYAMFSVKALAPLGLQANIIAALSNDSEEQMFKLAACAETDSDCIIREANKLFVDHGFANLEWLDVLRIYAAVISRQILAGTVTAKDGADRIAKATRLRPLPGDFHDLDTFRYASSEMLERPQDAELFERGIREAASQFASLEYEKFTRKRHLM